jgi:hypothetical protein
VFIDVVVLLLIVCCVCECYIHLTYNKGNCRRLA